MIGLGICHNVYMSCEFVHVPCKLIIGQTTFHNACTRVFPRVFVAIFIKAGFDWLKLYATLHQTSPITNPEIGLDFISSHLVNHASNINVSTVNSWRNNKDNITLGFLYMFSVSFLSISWLWAFMVVRAIHNVP